MYVCLRSQTRMYVCLKIFTKSLGFKNTLKKVPLEHSCSFFFELWGVGTSVSLDRVHTCMYVWALIMMRLERVCYLTHRNQRNGLHSLSFFSYKKATWACTYDSKTLCMWWVLVKHTLSTFLEKLWKSTLRQLLSVYVCSKTLCFIVKMKPARSNTNSQIWSKIIL